MFKRLLNKLKKLELNFIKTHQALLIRVLGALVVFSLLFNAFSTKTIRPAKAAEYAKTSVMVVNLSAKSGGSGVILHSSNLGSEILTNAHVCKVIKNGGFVQRESGERYLIHAYKISTQHDLCLIMIKANLRISTKVASDSPERYSEAHISGHPNLLPHVLTHAYFSGDMIINVMVDLKPCTDEQYRKAPFVCLFLGGWPVIETYEAQLVTGTIMAGSSGSAVFNEDGEIAGLVFAGKGGEGLSYAFIVPQVYVYSFTSDEADLLPWTYIDNTAK